MHPDPSQIRNDAFAALEPSLVGLRMQVFAALQEHGPCTTRQLSERCGMSILTLRPRVNELMACQLVECTGRVSHEGLYRALTLVEARDRRRPAIEPIQGVQAELGFGEGAAGNGAYSR